MTDGLETLRALLTDAERVCGGWCTVHVDLSEDRENPEGLAESRRRSIRDRLHRLGADEPTVQAIDDALSTPSGLPSPFSRYLLARAGEVVVDEPIPGVTQGETLEVGVLPRLAPLIATGVDEFSYLVVQTSRDGGEVAIHRTGAFFPEATASIVGRTDALHKVKGGGSPHHDLHEHVEEVWKQNQQELAVEIDRLVREIRPRLLVVAGDIKARGLLLEAIGQAARSIAVELDANTRSDGTDGARLDAFVAQQVAAVEQRDRADAIDLLRSRVSQERAAADVGLREVVGALQQAQVDTLFIDIPALDGETLLALDGVPWVARPGDETGDAAEVGEVAAAEGVLRAALLTDARILTATQQALGAGAAALLRWPVASTAGA